MLSLALKAVLGNYSGQKSEKKDYFFALSNSGAVYRIDYYIYSFEYKSEKLIKLAKNVVVFDYIISAVDTRTLNVNIVLSLIEICFKQLEKPQKKKLAEEVMRVMHMRAETP